MDGTQPNTVSVAKRLNNRSRFQAHDDLENEVMDILRPFTTRRHLPDRWVSFGGILCPFDVKTTSTCEDKSHDEYARLSEAGFGMFIVYRAGEKLFANWFDDLVWVGPLPPSPKSRSGDPFYYIESGGKPLSEWLRNVENDIKRKDFTDVIGLLRQFAWNA